MFRRRRSRAPRAKSWQKRARRRQRRLTLEPLEDRRLMAIMTVSNLDDDTLANLAGDSQLSLREAIQAINTGAAVDGIGPTSGVFGTNDEIRFDPALFAAGMGMINLADAAGELGLTRAMTITGPGSALLTIDAGDGADNNFNTGDGFRIFNADDSTAADRPVTLTGLTLTGGDVADVGGAIRTLESLAVRDSVITGNAAFGIVRHGGGIDASLTSGALEITRTTITRNTAAHYGGGINVAVTTGTVDIDNSTISYNSSGSNGGGIRITAAGGDVTITNSTISANDADHNGGGLYAFAAVGSTVTLAHSTVAFNTADADATAAGSGGGLYGAGPGTIALDHTIIARNQDISPTDADDVDFTTSAPGTLTVNFSLIGDNTASGLAAANPDGNGNIIGTGAAPIDARLGPLAGNGGQTDTHALLAGSPAIDRGNLAIIMPPTGDQRGTPFVRIAGAGPRIDMGAYERQTVAGLSFVVDILADENDGNYAPGDLSLREAVGLANGSIGPNTITFAASLNGGTILLKLGEIRITDEVTIDASNLASRLTVDASGNDDNVLVNNGGGSRIFNIDEGDFADDNPVELVGLILTGGDASGDGGAILARESLTVRESVIDGNAGLNGGGIAVFGGPITMFNLDRSTVSGNFAGSEGGGLYLEEVQSLITNSTISGNSADEGGGIYTDTDDDGTPSTLISNSTISGNSASLRGGGISNRDGLTLIRYATITDNTAPAGQGSGVASFGDAETLTRVRSTIIAGNTNSDINLIGGATNSFESLGYNLIGSGTGVGEFGEPGDQTGVANPGLAPLALNGGPTRTHRVLATSPALDNGDPASVAGVGGVPQFDQRGNPLTRVFDSNAGGMATIDIGAFELNVAPLDPDRFEDNETQATATNLGSPPFLTEQFLTIHDVSGDDVEGEEPPDEDFYKYVAHDTGKLGVRIYFTHALGDLDMEILDRNGNVIIQSLSFDDDEVIIIPVVSQQMYFVHVFGANLGNVIDTNEYTLEIENFPTPVPTGVVLDPASDSGMMDNDAVTGDNTPTIYIQTDVLNFVDTNGTFLFEDPDTDPNGDAIDVLTAAEAEARNQAGIAVQITLVNTTTGVSITGFANPLIPGSPEIFVFTVSDGTPLTDGVYIITARTVIFDPLESILDVPTPVVGRSNASPPLRLVVDTVGAPAGSVSADMLDASDTGMFDDDNVTNKMQPAFQGTAPAGAKIRLFANGELVGQTVAGSDSSDVGHAVGGIGGLANDGLGLWEITVEPLADNGYDIRLEIEDGAGNVTAFDPRFNGPDERIDIVVDTLDPNTPYLDLIDDTGRHDNDNITRDNTPTVTMTSTDPNIALAQLLFADNLKFRIYDRYENTAEFLLYDSAQDADVDAMNVAADMFTALTLISEQLPDQFFALFGGAANAAVIDMMGIGRLADGVHNLKLEVEDRAGNFSHDFLLEITIDTATPPISFGLVDGTSATDGLTASSDTGVTTVPETYADRVTSDTTPTVWGRAEADSIVRVYLDLNNNGILDLTTDTFLGQTVAVPLDGNDAFPDGYWELTSALDLNQIVGLPKDGLRRLLATAQDVAGNPVPTAADELPIIVNPATLDIFIDTQGPQITDVNLGPGFDDDLFDPKPSAASPTPLVHSLFIDVRDLPFRLDQAGTTNDFLYHALVEDIAETLGNYVLVGDSVGHVIIQEVIVHFEPIVNGQPAFASIELVFAEPLPDDRYTLTVRDNLVDPAGNRLDGESGVTEPSDDPTFASGDGVPGGNFVARFTVDSRPEIGVWAAGTVLIDTNGNFLFDPETFDFTNRDLTYTLGFPSDYVFAGNFVFGAGATADGFDKLAAYGRVGNQWRFLIDVTNDGVPDHQFVSPTVNGIPVAGNFDGNAVNGDEIGIFTGSSWFFDTNHDFVVDTSIAAGYAGFPVVGDFDGDGDDDVGTYVASTGGNFFHIDLNTAGAGAPISINGAFDHGFRIGVPGLGTFGFPGVRERPVAADMNGDGVDDLGLWVPDGAAILPGDQGEWFFLLSDFDPRTGTPTQTVIDRIVSGGTVFFVPFSTTPFGNDLYARFGNSFALPIVGNFDPPVTSGAAATPAAVTVTPPAPAAAYVASAEPAPVWLPVPPIAPAAANPSTSAATTKASKASKATQPVYLPVPAITPAATNTTANIAAAVVTSTKSTKATAGKIDAPQVKPTKSTKATKVKTPSPTNPVSVPVTIATQSSVVSGTIKKKTVTTTVVESVPVAVVATVAKAASTPVAVKASKTVTVKAHAAVPAVTSQPHLAKVAKVAKVAPAPSRQIAAKVAKTAVKAQPVTKPIAIKPAASIETSDRVDSSIGGLLNFATHSESASSDTDDSSLFAPAVADAAVVDLRLTLADIATDAVAADAEAQFGDDRADQWQCADIDADDLALELAWESVALGVL